MCVCVFVPELCVCALCVWNLEDGDALWLVVESCELLGRTQAP